MKNNKYIIIIKKLNNNNKNTILYFLKIKIILKYINMRCPIGTRKNNKTGVCEKKNYDLGNVKRCGNGKRINIETGQCEEKKNEEEIKKKKYCKIGTRKGKDGICYPKSDNSVSFKRCPNNHRRRGNECIRKTQIVLPNDTLKTKKTIRLKKPTTIKRKTIIKPRTLEKVVQSKSKTKPKSNNNSQLDDNVSLDDIEIINLDDDKVPTNLEDFI